MGFTLNKENFTDDNNSLSENTNHDARKTEEKIKKTFCDVDSSLKELNKLDTLDKNESKNDIGQPSVQQEKKSDKDSKLKKSKKSGRPKQDKTKCSNGNEAEESASYSVSSRSLRRRCKNHGETENSKDTGENFSSSLDNEADAICKVILDKSEEIGNPLPLENTPENSPDKIHVNEQKIKSSLKKKKNLAILQESLINENQGYPLICHIVNHKRKTK